MKLLFSIKLRDFITLQCQKTYPVYNVYKVVYKKFPTPVSRTKVELQRTLMKHFRSVFNVFEIKIFYKKLLVI